ncbi:thiol:disulfide interchange protein precursor [bacterium BMS3Abin08]|nr:thiol:disulfide interchange protein precursor [bacterium BMS3Abin08]
MRKLSISVMVLMLILLSGLWSTLYAADIKMLYFYEKGCKWCAMMDKVLQDTTIKSILDNNTEIDRIDIKGNKITAAGLTGKELAKKYNVRGVPTLIFLDSSKKEIIRIPGALKKEDFRNVLCEYISAYKTAC